MNKLAYFLVLLTCLTACSQDKQMATMTAPATAAVRFTPPVVVKKEEEVTRELPGAQDLEEVAAAPITAGAGAAPSAPAQRPPAAPRLLIYHAELRLKVAGLAQATAHIDSLVRRKGGYVSAAEETRDDDSNEWRQEMTIRVRPGGFESMLAAIGRLGTVESKKLTTDDVTAQHADVSARLRTKRAVEQRYVALLGQARKIQDILDIEEKIGEVREEIESTESRLKTLNDEVAYSTITLTCYQPLARPTPDAPIVSLGSRVVEAFYNGWTLLTGLFIGMISIWPLLLLGMAGLWALRRWRRNLKAARA
ncbi:hypothetical protein GCM10023185_07500 [Hymenobacter saemangeumensis]|uniref:DUF4349 domain-containing protein n=1 Tax=Hymenobacter saemangeumensis TaxID=1084522 RepID=A0ABP8I2M1_9BACT